MALLTESNYQMAPKTARKPKPDAERRSEVQPNRISPPPAAFFSFLKETKGITSWTARDLAKTLDLSPASTKQALAVLEMQGYVKPAESKGEWITTPAG